MSLPATRPAGGPLAPVVLGAAYRALIASWRIRHHDRAILDDALAEGPALVVCWHGDMLMTIGAHAHMGLVAMASLSADGELIARVLSQIGYGLVRGSSSRGGGSAVRACLRHLHRGASPAITVDGPRGPRFSVQPGTLLLAALSRRPIIYMAAEATPAIRLGSWDRQVIPAPLARVSIRYGRMEAPDKSDIEAARVTLEARMRALSGVDEAPRRADRGSGA